ncbi:MAG: SlyX family protein [Gammaproteobacteria bacterium]|nr:SlyX family protein [Gammaproteobacteria bacterium]
MSTRDSRLETIESKLSFQDDALQQLGEALVAQQSRIDRLEASIRSLAEQLRALKDTAPDAPEPPPPHY